jgi:TonB family protein
MTIGVGADVENPRYLSPSGELCLVIRQHPEIGDFERVSSEEYWREDPVETWLNEIPLEQPEAVPPEPAPVEGALYRLWPSGDRELLAEVAFRSGERYESVLVADDGHFVTAGPVRCEADAELLTIRAADGSVVRTLRVRDLLTPRDQQWLCRGSEGDVWFSIGETLRMTVLIDDSARDDSGARQETVDIDLATGSAPRPERNRCPAPDVVTAEAVDGRSQALLDRAVVRVLPEYPEIAAKARVSGVVIVQIAVGDDGTVEEAEIVKPLPFGLDKAVRDAILKWKFAPGAAPASGLIRFHFEIVRHYRPRTMV